MQIPREKDGFTRLFDRYLKDSRIVHDPAHASTTPRLVFPFQSLRNVQDGRQLDTTFAYPNHEIPIYSTVNSTPLPSFINLEVFSEMDSFESNTQNKIDDSAHGHQSSSGSSMNTPSNSISQIPIEIEARPRVGRKIKNSRYVHSNEEEDEETDQPAPTTTTNAYTRFICTKWYISRDSML